MLKIDSCKCNTKISFINKIFTNIAEILFISYIFDTNWRYIDLALMHLLEQAVRQSVN